MRVSGFTAVILALCELGAIAAMLIINPLLAVFIWISLFFVSFHAKNRYRELEEQTNKVVQQFALYQEWMKTVEERFGSVGKTIKFDVGELRGTYNISNVKIIEEIVNGQILEVMYVDLIDTSDDMIHTWIRYEVLPQSARDEVDKWLQRSLTFNHILDGNELVPITREPAN